MRTSKAKYFNITMNDRRSRHIRPVSPTSSCFCPGYATGEVKVSPQTSNEEWNKDKTRIAAPDAWYNQVKGKAIRIASATKIGRPSLKDSRAMLNTAKCQKAQITPKITLPSIHLGASGLAKKNPP